MVQQVRHHHGQIVALIRAALNRNDFLIKGTHAADHSTGRSSDGIVIILHPVRLTDKLNAMLHAAKGAGHLSNLLRLHQSPHRRDGRAVISNIVPPGQTNIGSGHNLRHRTVLCIDDIVVLI